MNRLHIRSTLGAWLAGAMRKDACEAVPDDVDLWPQIEARLRTSRSRGNLQGFVRHFSSLAGRLMSASGTQQPRYRSYRSYRYRNAPVMVPLFMLVLVAWGLAAFAIGRQTGAHTRELPVYRDSSAQSSSFSGTELASDGSGDMLLERVLDTARLEEVRRAGLMNHIGLSQEARGCIAQIKQTYADANRLIIGMTAQVPGTSPGQLRIYGGVVSIAGAGNTGRNPLLLYETSTSNSSGTAARLLVYDMSLLDPMPDELNMAVEVSVAVGPVAGPRSNSCSEPFRFNLDVPVSRAGTSIIQPDRAVTVGGETVTLEKIMITPAATQAIVRVEAEEADPGNWGYMSVRVAPDGPANERSLDAGAASPASYVQLIDGRRSLELVRREMTSNGGTWTLTVDYLEKKGSRNTSSARERLRGPWTFQFEVPAR